MNKLRGVWVSHRKLIVFKGVIAIGITAEHFLPAHIAKPIAVVANMMWLVAF